MSATPQQAPAGVTGVRGTAGGQLSTATSPGWSANRNAAAMGAAGERRTAALLACWADRCLVLHDVHIPIKGVRANVDHLVISGSRVLLVDTKVWEPGTYWTFAGTHRHGMRSIDQPLSRSVGLARDGWAALAARNGGGVVEPVTVIWPARPGAAVSVNRLEAPVGTVVAGTDLEKVLSRFVTGPAEPALAKAATAMLVRS